MQLKVKCDKTQRFVRTLPVLLLSFLFTRVYIISYMKGMHSACSFSSLKFALILSSFLKYWHHFKQNISPTIGTGWSLVDVPKVCVVCIYRAIISLQEGILQILIFHLNDNKYFLYQSVSNGNAEFALVFVTWDPSSIFYSPTNIWCLAQLWEFFYHIFSSIYFIKYAMFDMKYFLGCLPTIFGAHITWVTIKRRKYGFV